MRAGSCMSQQGSRTTPAPDKQRAAPAAGAGQGFDSWLVTPSWGSPSWQGWDSSTTRYFTNITFLVLSKQHHPAVGRGEAPVLSILWEASSTELGAAMGGNRSCSCMGWEGHSAFIHLPAKAGAHGDTSI